MADEQAKIDEEFRRIVTTDLDLPKRSKFVKIALLVLVLIAIGAGTWYYIMKKRKLALGAAENVESRPSSATRPASSSAPSSVIISTE